MTIQRIPPADYPKFLRGGLGRRGMALTLDFFGIWLVSSFLASNQLGIQFAQIFVFIFGWLLTRAVIPFKNRGQSLGRWLFDLQILEFEGNRIPELFSLVKREAIICLGLLLFSIAFSNIIRNPTAIVLMIPLAIDCGAAFSDTQARQALHDRYARTMVISSQRGYSLDIKVKRLVERLRRDVRK